MPVVSGMAFAADAAVEVVAVLLTEKATQTRRIGATIIGAVQPVSRMEGLSTPEIRPFLAVYREGLNSNSPLYQALCFYKVIEGVSSFHTKQARASSRSGGAVGPDPLLKRIPTDPNDLPPMTHWVRDVQACRDITPVLRYVAREVIRDAMSSSSVVPRPHQDGG